MMTTARKFKGAPQAGNGKADAGPAPHNIDTEQALLCAINGYSLLPLKFARLRSRRRPGPLPSDPFARYQMLSPREILAETAAQWAAEEAGQAPRSAVRSVTKKDATPLIDAVTPDRRRDPVRDARTSHALRIRIAALVAERRALSRRYLSRDRRHRQRQTILLNEIEDTGDQIRRFRSLVHRLEFNPADEGGNEGRIAA
jgi:hypothetical protein